MKIDTTKLLYQIALTQIDGVGDVLAKNILEVVGSAKEIFESSKKALTSIKGISDKLVNEILNPTVLIKAEKELEFVLKNKIQTYFFTEDNYPYRLKECSDSPILLYFKGNTDLNAQKIISIVGTRKSTNYGNLFCSNFIKELSYNFPDILIVSGLAYGIDIEAHRAALNNDFNSIAVLAHGLDRIYPSAHRRTAIEMLEKGGILTEFTSNTEPDKFNFVRRNRIVAGLSDATIVVESGTKGGSLITADLANSYNREVFATPGRITDKESIGCNMLIEQNKAILLQSAESFIKQMQWDVASKQTTSPKIVQHSLFFDLDDQEQQIYDLLSSTDEPLHSNFISNQVGISVSSLLSILISMEMKELIINTPGSFYKLNK